MNIKETNIEIYSFVERFDDGIERSSAKTDKIIIDIVVTNKKEKILLSLNYFLNNSN